MDLPVAERWFDAQEVGDGITLLVERHVDPFLLTNVWHVRGSDRDLVVDTANGLGALRPVVEPAAGGRPLVAVATHAHFDHVGGLGEFDERWVHRDDAPAVIEPEEPLRLLARDLSPGFIRDMAVYAYRPPEILIHALPEAGFEVEGFRTRPCRPTRLLEEGDVVDLGDRRFEVLHVPGHTPGSIALWDEADALLFTGDTVYPDDVLHGEDPEAFHRSLRRLRDLPARRVFGGHNRLFDGEELLRIIDGVLAG